MQNLIESPLLNFFPRWYFIFLGRRRRRASLLIHRIKDLICIQWINIRVCTLWGYFCESIICEQTTCLVSLEQVSFTKSLILTGLRCTQFQTKDVHYIFCLPELSFWTCYKVCCVFSHKTNLLLRFSQRKSFPKA